MYRGKIQILLIGIVFVSCNHNRMKVDENGLKDQIEAEEEQIMEARI